MSRVEEIQKRIGRVPTHGAYINRKGTPEYMIWQRMKARCHNPNDPDYKNYGGRGIVVCERWSDFGNFISDMGLKPKGFSIERRNNDGNYEPSNCSWESSSTQAKNRRDNNVMTFGGETKIITDWARGIGISVQSLRFRLKHWPIDRAMKEPPYKSGTRSTGKPKQAKSALEGGSHE